MLILLEIILIFRVVLTFAVLIFIVFSIGKVYMMKMSDSY